MSYRYLHHLHDPEPPLPAVRNVAPVGRARRMSRRDRERQEKDGLKGRHGGYERHGAEVDHPFDIDEASSSFMPDAARFHGDVAGDVRRERAEARAKEGRRIRRIRREHEERDARRNRAQAHYEVRETERYDAARREGREPEAVKGSTQYDLITLESRDPKTRRALKYEEDVVRHAASVRTQKLQDATNRSGYNPITGETVRRVQLHPRPDRSKA